MTAVTLTLTDVTLTLTFVILTPLTLLQSLTILATKFMVGEVL